MVRLYVFISSVFLPFSQGNLPKVHQTDVKICSSQLDQKSVPRSLKRTEDISLSADVMTPSVLCKKPSDLHCWLQTGHSAVCLHHDTQWYVLDLKLEPQIGCGCVWELSDLDCLSPFQSGDFQTKSRERKTHPVATKHDSKASSNNALGTTHLH